MDPKTPLKHFPGVGTYYQQKLARLGIETLEDLIYYFPFRYDNFTTLESNATIPLGEKVNIKGTVWDIKNIRTRSGKFLTRALVSTDSGTIEVVWFNQPYLTKNIKPQDVISLSGKVKQEGSKISLIAPTYEVIKQELAEPIHTTGLVSVYSETEGLTSKWLRTKIKTFLPIYLKSKVDYLPGTIIKNQVLMGLLDSLEKIHFPKVWEDVESSRKRLGFDEIFLTQLISLQKRYLWEKTKKSPRIKVEKSLLENFKTSLPFKLTQAQEKATGEILDDIDSEKSSNRLLEGDVGSGKTVVAAIASLFSVKNHFEVIFAAPTEILAFQHFKTLSELLLPFNVKVGIWTKSKKERGDITVGTHALLVNFEPKKQLGLVVVDEQHRFGVAQRTKLFQKENQKLTPHLLTMTATPIPRTLALTIYGDLSLSVLDEMPTGRQKISTFVVPNKKRADCYKFIQKEVESGRQAFIITPFVEPSESMETVKAATVELERLKKTFVTKPVILSETKNLKTKSRSFAHAQDDNKKGARLGLLHGRLKSKEKEAVMQKFKEGKIDILVATPVVEVGIDVPNATVMMIESADRFGLAQLHQLRGRVGRGQHKSYCFLFTDSDSQNSLRRLKSMEKVFVGFELAQIDLKMRGPGQIYGLKQSGFENFKIADIFDAEALKNAQDEARTLLATDPNLEKYPSLKEKLKEEEISFSEPN